MAIVRSEARGVDLPTPVRCPSTHEGSQCRKDIGHYPAELHGDGTLAWSDAPPPPELRALREALERDDFSETVERVKRRFEEQLEQEAQREQERPPVILHLRAHRARVRALCGDRVEPRELIDNAFHDVRRVGCMRCWWTFAWSQVARGLLYRASTAPARAEAAQEGLALHWALAATAVVGVRHLVELCRHAAEARSRFSLLETD